MEREEKLKNARNIIQTILKYWTFLPLMQMGQTVACKTI